MAKITWVLDDEAKKILEQAVEKVLQWYIEREFAKKDENSTDQEAREAKEEPKPRIGHDAYDTARAYASRLVNTGRKGHVLDILGYFGAAKISDIPEDKIAEVAEKLKALVEAEPF